MLKIVHSQLPNLVGTRILLKPLYPEDVSDTYVSWLNDIHVNSYLECRFTNHTLKTVKEFVKLQVESGSVIFYGIWSKEGIHIGNIKIGPIDKYHLTADIGFLIGNREYWGKGIASDAIHIMCNLAFGFGIKKITAGAYENNIGSIKALEKCGFVKEGYRKEQVIKDGVRFGTYLFGLLC